MRVIFHYQLSLAWQFFADAFKKAFAKNTLSILNTRCDKRNLWMDFFCYFGVTSCTSAAQNFCTFFLLKKGTRIVQRAILKEILFLCSRKIFIVSVHTVCVYAHYNASRERESLFCLRKSKERKENRFLKPAKIWWILCERIFRLPGLDMIAYMTR